MVSVLIISKQFDKAIADAVGLAEEDVRGLVNNIYNSILDSSPIITGHYKSNHRISIRGTGGQFTSGSGVKLTKKDEGAAPGTLDTSAETAQEELGKLSRFKLGDVVLITTRVEYAEAVEQKYGVYAGAQALVEL